MKTYNKFLNGWINDPVIVQEIMPCSFGQTSISIEVVTNVLTKDVHFEVIVNNKKAATFSNFTDALRYYVYA
jgi:hypothetical protein